MSGEPHSRWPSPYVLLALTMLFWAGNAVVARAMHEALPPLAMAFWRWALALMLVLPFTVRGLYRQRRVLRRNWKALAALGLLSVASYNTFLYTALQTTTATNGLLISAVTPVFIVLVSRIGFGVRMTRRQLLGVTLSIAGILAIVCRGDPHNLFALRFNRGDFYLLMAALCWSIYSACLKWRPPELDAFAFFTVTVAVGVAMLAPLYAWETLARAVPAWTPAVYAAIAYIAVFPSVLAYMFWNRGVNEVGANRAGYFIYLLPVFGTALAVIFLGESLFLFHAIGVVFIFIGIYLASARTVRLAPARNRPPPQ